MPIALRFAARSDLGLGSKSRNEDSAFASPDMLVLADGMGGHAAGDTASSTVVAELIRLDGESYTADEALSHLQEAVARANDRLREEMDSAPDTEGMGTTCIAFLRSGNMLAQANIGDSRAYLLREGVFSQITKDHSFVQALLDEGRITPEEAEHHPQRSLVTRVLTGREDDEPDLSLREARIGDRYLLCSDGLSDYVAHGTIEDIVRSHGSPGEIADRLIAIALRASTRDNVTVVVADVVNSGEPTSTTPQIVGAAAARQLHEQVTPAPESTPQTPAEKAAALSREANAGPAQQVPVAEAGPAPMLAEERGRRFGKWHVAGILALVVAMLAVASYVAYDWTQRQVYVGVSGGNVAIFKGVSDNFGPITLHSVDQRTDLQLISLPSAYRSAVTSTVNVDNMAAARTYIDRLRGEAAKCQADASGACPS